MAECRAYTDPPMHVECGEAAMRLCPRIARPTMKGATDDRVRTASAEYMAAITRSGMELERPESWVLYVTRQYDIELRGPAGSDGERGAVCPLYRPAPPKGLREFRYGSNGELSEV